MVFLIFAIFINKEQSMFNYVGFQGCIFFQPFLRLCAFDLQVDVNIGLHNLYIVK